jgi:hypothetical protein
MNRKLRTHNRLKAVTLSQIRVVRAGHGGRLCEP